MKFSMYARFPELLQSEGIEKAAVYAKSLGFSSVEMLKFIYKEKPECVKHGARDAVGVSRQGAHGSEAR